MTAALVGIRGRPEDRVVPVMVALSILVHAAGIALAVWIAHREPPKILPVQKPVTAKLVRLGKPRDKRLLPRKEEQPPPPPPPPKPEEARSDIFRLVPRDG